MRPADGSFRPSGSETPQDWEAAAEWLRAAGHELDFSQVRQFAGGVANLNYLVRLDGVDVVVRRPPAGPLASGASDMAREWKVLQALHPGFALAPRPILFGDARVWGAPFQVMEYRPGIAVGGSISASLGVNDRVLSGVVQQHVGVMASLHDLDTEMLGLGDWGRPEGFMERQVSGWARRAEHAFVDGVPASAVRIIDWLAGRRVPTPRRVSLLHGDLKLDNVLLDPTSLRPVAVIDWEIAARGDPLFDLAVLLSYWVEPSDPHELRDLAQVPSLTPGAPSRAEIAHAYGAVADADVSDLDVHLTLARLRLGVAWQQLYVLHKTGAVTGDRYVHFNRIACAVLDWTADHLTEAAGL